MRITRYTQSCLLIEEGNTKILIDAGVDARETGDLEKLPKADALLFTHEHADHFDAQIAEDMAGQGIMVVANESTAKLINADIKVVKTDEEFKIGNVDIRAIPLPHCLMPTGAEGPMNTGYLLNGKLFNPGDSTQRPGDLIVDNLILPITGPDISMRDAFMFAEQLEAKTVIPVHYDKLGAKPEVYAAFAERFQLPFKWDILTSGQSTEL